MPKTFLLRRHRLAFEENKKKCHSTSPADIEKYSVEKVSVPSESTCPVTCSSIRNAGLCGKLNPARRKQRRSFFASTGGEYLQCTAPWVSPVLSLKENFTTAASTCIVADFISSSTVLPLFPSSYNCILSQLNSQSCTCKSSLKSEDSSEGLRLLPEECNSNPLGLYQSYLSKESEKLPEGSSPRKPFVCPTCGKGFRLSSTLCRHKIIHTTQRPHKCYACTKSFNRSSTLKTHLRTHSNVKEYQCNFCGKGFHQKGNLRNHVLIHTGEKPWACDICQKKFNKLSNLKFHMHAHTDQKPYRCRFCKHAMTRRRELKQHISKYHPNVL